MINYQFCQKLKMLQNIEITQTIHPQLNMSSIPNTPNSFIIPLNCIPNNPILPSYQNHNFFVMLVVDSNKS